MSKISDLLGTFSSYFRIGKTGPRLKDNSGKLEVRDSEDTAYAEVVTSKANVTGNDIVINSDAAGSGNDFSVTISKNSGATANLQIVAPPAKGTDGYVLAQKAGTGAGVLELELVSAGSTSQCVASDTTSVAFGASSPVTCFTLPANAVVEKVHVVVDTAFNGTAPSLSVGISGSTSKYMPATALDLKTAGLYEWHPALTADGTTNAIIATYSADSSSAGAARVIVYYSIPT